MSDSPTAPSGFGNVTRSVCAGLAARGHTVDILGWQHHGAADAWQGCTVHPVARDGLGADALPGYLRRLRPDVLVTLADIWWLTWIDDPAIRDFRRMSGTPWVLYYPVDGDLGGRRLPASWVSVLKSVDLPVAMSRYGLEVAAANGVRSSYIPHGVDIEVFRPSGRPREKDAPFVVLSDARNQPRKMLPRTLETFRRFAAGKPDAVLHLHCDPDDPAATSPIYRYDIRADLDLLTRLQPRLRGKVRFTPGMSVECGLPLAGLAAIYKSSDVHLLSSWGEGFGLPTLQAAAAGVVPLAVEGTANSELVEGHGEAVRAASHLTDEFGVRRALIDIDDAVARLDRLYGDRELLAERSAAARRFAEGYAWHRVCDSWHELLTSSVPPLRRRAGIPDVVTSVLIDAASPASGRPRGGSDQVAGAVRHALGQLPDGARVSVSVAHSQAGRLTAGVLRDASRAGPPLTLPVTLPPVDPGVRHRVPGRVYAASAADVPVLRALARVFPGLSVWSDGALDLGTSEVTGRPVRVPPVEPDKRERMWATTTLAVDLAGAAACLPRDAIRHGVPLVRGGERDALSAVDAARTLLLDQSVAAAACAARPADHLVASGGV